MHAGFDESTSECRQCITSVDGDGPILGPHPLPLSFRVQNLKCGHRLSEKQGHSAQVCMPGTVKITDFLVLFRSSSCVVHVPKVIFTADVILMIADELILVGKLKENCE